MQEFPRIYRAFEEPSRERAMERHAIRRESDGRVIATVTMTGWHMGEEPSGANWAALFSAAVDFLEAGRRALALMEKNGLGATLEACQMANAIAKAEGRRT